MRDETKTSQTRKERKKERKKERQRERERERERESRNEYTRTAGFAFADLPLPPAENEPKSRDCP
jgi:hypothetical protein